MSSSTLVLIAAWTCLFAGFGVMAALAYLVTEDEVDEAVPLLVFAAGAASAIAAVTLGLHLARFTTPALWTGRILGLAYLVAAVALATRVDEKVVDRLAAMLNFVVAGVITAGSFAMRGALVQPPPSLAAPTTVITIQGVGLWHGIALGLLAVFTVVFLIMFIRTMERGGAPQFESHWGGIGGGLSGWRVSSSLTYLAGALVFGLLFAFFVFQLDPSRRGQPAASGAPPPQGRTQTPAEPGSTTPSTTPENNPGASATTGVTPSAGGQPSGGGAPAAGPAAPAK